MNRALTELEQVLLAICALCLLLAFNAIFVANLTLLALAVHELGHAAVYLWIRRRLPTLRVCRDGLRMGSTEVISYRDQLYVALGGPCVNLLFVPLCLALRPLFGDFMTTFSELHLLLALSNLLPIQGRDGDVALRCILSHHGREEVYDTLAPILTLGVEILFTLLALYAVRTFGEGYLPAAVFLCGLLRSLSDSARMQKMRI